MLEETKTPNVVLAIYIFEFILAVVCLVIILISITLKWKVKKIPLIIIISFIEN